ncbi:ABC transporter substrate-binding protein [Gulosibacter molinativorax]|uniref:ABC transporter substrate-binding protein n=1 Tax=Gulosibacter molinativorax TaxID=256821 RepID=A0ABT7CBH2_9MICO|nr:ABC transporter substrate-binding protein [Gulosibacter molinativorax]MDJ1371986.1 ABC transporter substrate-binding protein [Gulosibacter molinativorax]QUY62650.1 Maltose/maltodextrin transport system substrate-binding protein [Gulosibacter molinativorax]
MKSRIAVKSAIALFGATALALAGCASGSPGETGAGGGETAAAERGPITFAMGANDTGKLVPIIEAWNAEHPDEEVTLSELPQEADQQRETLVQSLQANSGDYDVMALDVTWTAEFAANGWLQPLEGDLALDTTGLLPATVDSATYMGTLYAGPQNTNAQLLYYRTDLVDKAPATWTELIDSCGAAEEAGVDCLVLQLKNYEGLTVQTTQAINANGGAVVDEDGSTPLVEEAGAKAGLQSLVDAYAAGEIAQRTDSFTEEETNLAFVGGESMYAYNWPYMYDNAGAEESQVKGNFEVAPIVGPDGPGASTLGGYNNGINMFSEYKATALDFIKFVQSEENQKSFAEQSFPPVLASVYEDSALIEQFPYLPTLKDALDTAQPRPVTPYYAAISKAIHDNAYAAITAGKSVDDAMADMAAAIRNAAA